MLKNRIILYHLIAILTVAIWGTTFVSTKILIAKGLSPSEIFLYRFLLAYGCILLVSSKKFRANSLKDEVMLMLCGIFGGSLYFIAENTALGITLASNVSLLICTTPILTALLFSFFHREKLHKRMLYGSFTALLGVSLIVFNGSILLKINPLGDFLTIIAATSWAFYCLLLKKLGKIYSTLFITRKVFFYGILSLGLYSVTIQPINLQPALLTEPVVFLNLLFLGIVASMLCYIMWNATVKILGASKATNYIYIVPLVTLLTSAAILNETITLISLVGSLCIIGGVYLAERKDIQFNKKKK